MATGQGALIKISDQEQDQFNADTRVEAVKLTGGLTVMECPVRLGLTRSKTDMFLLPLEPTVSIRGRKVIVERTIAKNREMGSVKEQWAIGDYSIELTGMLIGDGTYPDDDVARLEKLLTADRSLAIQSILTDAVGIELLCVTDWDFPATPGVENQAYTIRGLSDRDFELIE